MGVGSALLGTLLATLLDLAIEPVAAHVVQYWEWLAPGSANYYGVPLANFVAWFVVAFALLVVVDAVLGGGQQVAVCPENEIVREEKRERVTRKDGEMGMAMRMAVLTPPVLFGGSILMFGLIDLTAESDWKRDVLAYRDHILDLLANYKQIDLTDLHKYIVCEAILTPEDFKRLYGANAGSIYGLSCTHSSFYASW